MDEYVAGQILIGVVLSVLLAFAGRMVVRNRASEHFPTAMRMFVLWWLGLGGAWFVWAMDTAVATTYSGTGGALAILDWILVLLYFVFILMSFGSLFYYLLYLYLGNESLSWVVWLIYGTLTFALMLIFGSVNHPGAYVVTGITSAVFGGFTTVVAVLELGLLLPVIFGSLGLFLVVRRLNDPQTRYRLLLISVSLFVYLAITLLFGSNPAVQPTSAAGWAREIMNKVGLLVALGSLYLAYHPSGALRRRFDLPAEGSA